MTQSRPTRRGLIAAGASLAVAPRLAGSAVAQAKPLTLLNVSYDPTRELYKEINAAFASYWKAQDRPDHRPSTSSHGGSGKQARSVIDGLQADVVTLALADDIDEIASAGQAAAGRLAVAAAEQFDALHLDDRVPGAQGQPLGDPRLGRPGQAGHRGDHAQPEDLGRRALELSGGLGLGLRQPAATATAQAFVAQALQERAGARHRRARIDDDLRPARHWRRAARRGKTRRSWRSRSLVPTVRHRLSLDLDPGGAAGGAGRQERGPAQDTRGGRGLSELPVQPEAQDIIGKHFYRPRNDAAAKKYARVLKPIPMVTIDDTFGGWKKAQATHFADGGVFDQIYKPA